MTSSWVAQPETHRQVISSWEYSSDTIEPGWIYHQFTACGLLAPYMAASDLVNIDLVNGLLPDGAKLLTTSDLSSVRSCDILFIARQFHTASTTKICMKIVPINFYPNLPRANELKDIFRIETSLSEHRLTRCAVYGQICKKNPLGDTATPVSLGTQHSTNWTFQNVYSKISINLSKERGRSLNEI